MPGMIRGEITGEQYVSYIKELQTIPDKTRKILKDKERIQWFTEKQANVKDIFFIHRGIDYAICLEESIELKKINYIHSGAYATDWGLCVCSKGGLWISRENW